MDISILEDIGLTTSEIKVYLALLETGVTTAGPLIDKTRLQNSVVHMTLHKLVNKGFASYVLRGKIKHYHATSPNNVVKYIDEKKQRFEELLPELLAKQSEEERQEAEIYEGFKGFKNMLATFIEDAEPGDEYCFFIFYHPRTEENERFYAFYKEFDNERHKRGITVKGIAERPLEKYLVGRPLLNYKLVDFPILQNISIFRDKVIFTPFEQRTVSFLIRSQQLAESFRKYFHTIWDNA